MIEKVIIFGNFQYFLIKFDLFSINFLIIIIPMIKNPASNLDQKFDQNMIKIQLKPITISKLIQSPKLNSKCLQSNLAWIS